MLRCVQFLRLLLPAWAFGFALTAPAGAALIISGGSATVTPGGTGTVAFRISADPGTSYDLAAFGLELQISVSAGNSFLEFDTSQPDPYAAPGYVFSGASFFQDFGIPFWGTPFSTVSNSDTIAGGDFNDSLSGFTTVPSSQDLLAVVQFQAAAGASPGDTFQIALVPDAGFTYFQDPAGNALAYTSTAATVSVTSAVPAPPAGVLAGVGGLTVLLAGWRSRRRGGRWSRPVTDGAEAQV